MRILLATLLIVAAVPAAADVYKWVDREGKVHYGDVPPPNSAARAIDVPTTPAIEGRGEPVPVEPQAQEAPRSAAPAEAPPMQAAAPSASNRGMSFEVYIMLRQGMTEGELLQRAGPPDYESTDGTVGSSVAIGRRGNRAHSFNNLELRKFYYFPTPSDPFTTVVTLTGGLISDLQRTRQF